MQLTELYLNRQLYRAVQDTSTQDASYMAINNSQSSGYAAVTTGAGEAAYAVNSNTPTVSGTKIRAGYIDSENYEYVSGNFTVNGMRIDLNNGAIYAKNFAITSTGSAFFTGNISASTGSIGRWVIAATTLTGSGVVLDSQNGTIRTSSANGRVQLSSGSNALEVYDFVGTLRVRMSTDKIDFFGPSGFGGAGAIYSQGQFGYGILVSSTTGNTTLASSSGDVTVSLNTGAALCPDTSSLISLGKYGGLGWAELYFRPLSANPTAPDFANGSMYYNGVTEEMRFYTTGSGWKTISTGSVSLTLSGLTIDVTKNWLGYGIFNMGSLVISAGGSITLDGVNRTTWPSSGTTTLSGLTIDTNKNWGSWGISQVGTITQDSSASFYTNWIQVTGGGPQIGTSGGRFFTYASTLNYTTLVNGSDRALKENITPIEYGLATIQSLVPVRYKYIESPEYHLGFIAQDVQGVIPEIVSVDEETEMLGLSSTEIIAILVKAVQELKSEVELLKASL